MRRALRGRLAATLATTLVAAVLAGCSADEQTGSPGAESSLVEPSDAPTIEVKPVTSSGRIVGTLPRRERRRVEKSVSRVAVRWLEAGYLGKYPRRAFRDALPGFTKGARSRARGQLGLMSNRDIGARVTAVTPTVARVRVDLFAVDGRPVSGTAHVLLRFRTEGRIERRYRVGGRLMMTRHGNGWQVFAYDIAKSYAGPDGKQQQQQQKKKKKGDRA